MTRDELLHQIKVRLEAHYGERLKGVMLYGSEARGASRPDSDIDVLCLLEGPISLWKEIGACLEATRGLEIDGDEYRPIMIIPVDAALYRSVESGFLREVRREGVLL